MFESINGRQTAKLKSGSIQFKNNFKQIAVPFKIYADFESLLKVVRGSDRSNNTSYTEKYQKHIPCSFAYKVVCIDGKFSKSIVICKGKDAINKFIKVVLEMNYCQKIIKKHFNKNLVMPGFKCWTCNKLFDVGDNKV